MSGDNQAATKLMGASSLTPLLSSANNAVAKLVSTTNRGGRRVTYFTAMVGLVLYITFSGILVGNVKQVRSLKRTIREETAKFALPLDDDEREDDHEAWLDDTHPLEEAHVLFGLAGNGVGFFAEVEVALKSVLLNAPSRRPLTIHIMTDSKAHDALDGLIERTGVATWRTQQPITIRSYNTEPFEQTWKSELEHFFNETGISRLYRHAFGHSMGAWFRLFAYQVLPSTVRHVLYMDSDVVILNNLETLWQGNIDPINNSNSSYCFLWGDFKCSGFVVMNLNRQQELWDLARTTANISGTARRQKPNDQLIFRALHYRYPPDTMENNTVVGLLPDEWNNHLADGLWRLRKNLVKARPNVGMLHYNGGGDGGADKTYFQVNQVFLDMRDSYGISNYYIDLHWTWAKSLAAGKVDDGSAGYPMTILHKQHSQSNATAENTR